MENNSEEGLEKGQKIRRNSEHCKIGYGTPIFNRKKNLFQTSDYSFLFDWFRFNQLPSLCFRLLVSCIISSRSFAVVILCCHDAQGLKHPQSGNCNLRFSFIDISARQMHWDGCVSAVCRCDWACLWCSLVAVSLSVITTSFTAIYRISTR